MSLLVPTFLPIDGWTGYLIGSNGVVLSKRFKRPLKTTLSHDGYHRVTLYECAPDSAQRKVETFVHRIVAEHFVPGRSSLRDEVHFIDANKSNIDATNLKWVSNDENRALAVALGTTALGTKNASAKLDPDKVRAIRGSNMSNVALAAKYGVSEMAIRKVKTGQSWGHVK